MSDDIDYTTAQTFQVEDRVELHPACDLWMRGARYGTVKRMEFGFIWVEMDHQQVHKLQQLTALMLRHIR
jgi:hypothetical protein